MKLVFLSDCGHGWLRVSVAELINLGIEDKISAYSYVSPDRKWAYLEEDCDTGTYLQKKGWGAAEWQKNVKKRYSDRSSVRNYDSYASR